MSSFQFFFTVIIPITLITIMVGMGMSLTPAAFKVLLQKPKAVVLGLLGQMVFLPLVAVTLVSIIDVPGHVALGLVLLSTCPGGATSNAISFAAKADVALSVGLTAVNSVLIAFTMPLVLTFAAGLLSADAVGNVSIPKALMAKQLLMLCVAPIAVGMLIRHFFPMFAIRSESKVRAFTALMMLVVLLAYVFSQRQLLLENLSTMGVLVMLFMVSVMCVAWIIAKLGRLNAQQETTIIIEVGLQNTSVAVFVATSVLGAQEIGMVPATYGALMLFVVGCYSGVRFLRHRQAVDATA